MLAVVETLRAAGIDVWLEKQAIDAGANWGQEIADAIAGCAVFVLMSSSASFASRNVRQQITLTWKHGRPYLPLLLDTTPFTRELGYWLETAQWVEVFDRPAGEWLPKVQRVLGAGFGTRGFGIRRESGLAARNAVSRIAPPAVPARRHRVKPLVVGREQEQERITRWL